ncbi:MAG: pre-toxin TG domain-containing protein, partial [Clostridium sp.]
MSNIKLSRNELLRQAKNIRALKDEVDKILKNTGRTYNLLDTVDEVSTWQTRNSLEGVRGCARRASNELDLLCSNLYKAINVYDNKEDELRRLVTINKSSVNTLGAEVSNVGVRAISSLNKIKVKSRTTEKTIRPLVTIADINASEVNKNVGIGTKVKLTAVSSIGATSALSGLNTINQSINTLKSAHIEKVVGQKSVKSSSIEAVGKRTIKDIPVIGSAIKAGAKIVSVIIGKVQEIVSKIKEIVNKLFDDIGMAIERIRGKGFIIAKEWLGKAKDFAIGLKDGIVNILEGAVNCVIGDIKTLITCLVVVVSIVVQAVIGIVAALGYLVGMVIGISPQDNTFSASVEGFRDDTTNFFKGLAPDKEVFNSVQWFGDLLLSCVPVIGDGRDIVEFITGVDMVTGEKLTLTERILTGIFMLIPIVGAKAGREIVTKLFKHADELLPLIGKKMDELLDGISIMFNKGDEFAF